MGLPRRDHMLGCPVAILSILDMQGCPFLLCNFFQKGLAKNTIAAYSYNKLMQSGVENAQAFTMDLFNTFIAVGSLAALGYAVMVVILFVQTVRGKIYPFRWMCLLNPFLIMIVCIVLSKVLPRTAFVNGVIGLGQQSIGLFILFVTLHLTCKNSNQS